MTAIIERQSILHDNSMVADSVKAYPMSSYPALIPLSSPVNSLQAYTCSNSLLQNSYAAGFSPQKNPQRIEEPYLPHIPDTPSGLSASGLSMSGMDARKKELLSQRKQREFIPDNKKDDSYWDRRRRNNEAAKRSREKRRFNDMILEQRVVELSKENHILKAQLKAINEKYGIQSDGLVNVDQVMSSMPQSDQIIAINKRTKLSQALLSLRNSPSVTSILSPSGMCSSSSQQYQESSPGSPHYGYGSQDRSDSPDMYHDQMDVDKSEESMSGSQDSPHSSKDYSSIESQYYEQTALNLSSRSHTPPRLSTSPSFAPVEYTNETDLSRDSPILAESGSCLPLKLRHKTHLGEKDAAHSLLALQGIKSEPRESFNNHDDSDERDSGLNTSSASSPVNVYNNPPSYSDQTPRNDELEYENEQLRNQIEYLASEVASIKCILGKRPPHSEIDSDGSR